MRPLTLCVSNPGGGVWLKSSCDSPERTLDCVPVVLKSLSHRRGEAESTHRCPAHSVLLGLAQRLLARLLLLRVPPGRACLLPHRLDVSLHTLDSAVGAGRWVDEHRAAASAVPSSTSNPDQLMEPFCSLSSLSMQGLLAPGNSWGKCLGLLEGKRSGVEESCSRMVAPVRWMRYPPKK
jgi:hypothetical protein